MTPAAVVFDLDGTLVDSRPDIATAVNRMRAELGLQALSQAAVGAMVGEGARVLVHRALADAPAGTAPEPALERFLAHYALVCTVATRPYDGVEALLAACARRWPLALLTNKPLAMTRALLGHLGWADLFRPVFGGDSRPYRKPDGRGLLEIAALLAIAPAAVLLVGDSRIDAETARSAGSSFVWAEWGYAAEADRRDLASGASSPTPGALLAELEARFELGSSPQ